MSEQVQYIINVNGNANAVFTQLNSGAESLRKTVGKSMQVMNSFAMKMAIFNQVGQFFQGLSSTLENFNASGIQLNTSLADLSAITGQTGKDLQLIGQYARESAKAFGINAAGAVESYKIVLSKLGPEIAKQPQALKKMGDNIAILSKQMGGDATAAAGVLTTALNQFQVSTENPIAAADEMTKMMNIMAAAAKEGSAELPEIAAALENAGMAAKGAGVSFAETNAAIQVLDKAGKKGAEGGVALRNIMSIISRGRFLPPDVRDELQTAGVDINVLGNKTLSLTERLKPLKAVMGDTALISKLFGMENQNAAIALLSGLDTVDEYTKKIQGTNTAFEQARTIMESYAEKQKRVQARFDDLKISIFNATGDLGIWMQTLTNALVPLAQITPLLSLVGKGFVWAAVKVKAFGASVVSAGGIVSWFKRMQYVFWWQTALLGRSFTALANNVRKYTASLFGSTAATGGAIAGHSVLIVLTNLLSAAFGVLKTAVRAVSVAIYNIPIVGWIAAAIAGIIFLAKLLWDKSEGFRKIVFGVWEVIKVVFSAIFNVIKAIFLTIYNIVVDRINAIRQAFSILWSGLQWLWEKAVSVAKGIADFFIKVWQKVGSAVKYITEPIVRLFNWISGKLSGIGAWLKKTILEPVKKVFSSLWDFIKGILDKILQRLGRIFQPIIDFWNKVTGKTVKAYKEGEKKGTESWNKSREDKKGVSAIAVPKLPGVNTSTTTGGGVLGGAPDSVAKGAEATATGGTRNTVIHITMGKFFENIVLNGTVKENVDEIKVKMEECLYRALYSAQSIG